MNDNYDEKQVSLFCPVCKHKWILTSDKQITQALFDKWYSYAIKQHEEIHKK